jgi:hypothetical protein
MTIADLKAKLNSARQKLFRGLLPESLERVGGDYIDLAEHLLKHGKSIDGVGECVDMAIQNALQLEQKTVKPKKRKKVVDNE